MLICVGARVDVGQATRMVPDPDATPPKPNSMIEMPEPAMIAQSFPVIGLTFIAPADAGDLGVCLPRDTAEQLHKLLGAALEAKPDLVTASRMPVSMSG